MSFEVFQSYEKKLVLYVLKKKNCIRYNGFRILHIL